MKANSMNMKSLVAAAALALVATAANAQSVSQTSSTSDTVITANIPNLVSIEGLNDVTFDITADDINNPYFGGVDKTEKFCVYSNVTSTGNYNISVSGPAGTDAPFALSGAGGNLDMAVWVSDDENNPFSGAGIGGNGYAFPGGVKTGYQTARAESRATDLNCSNVGGTNAALQLRLNDAEILAAIAGSYSGTLVLTVSVP